MLMLGTTDSKENNSILAPAKPGRPGKYDPEKVKRATRWAYDCLPNAIINSRAFTDAELRVLHVIVNRIPAQDENGVIQPLDLSGKAGSRQAMISDRSWWPAVRKLESAGLLTIERVRKSYQACEINRYLPGPNFRPQAAGHQPTDDRRQRTEKAGFVRKPPLVQKPTKLTQKNLPDPVQNISPMQITAQSLTDNNNISKIILPTTKSFTGSNAENSDHPVEDRQPAPKPVPCRADKPPKNSMELSDRVAALEDILSPLRQAAREAATIPQDETRPWALPDEAEETPGIATQALWFWDMLARLDRKLATEMFHGRFGMVDGLWQISRAYLPTLAREKFFASFERHGRTAALMLLSVAWKTYAGSEDGAEQIRRPAAYFIGALNNSGGTRPLLSISYQVYRDRDRNNPLDCYTDGQLNLARLWAEKLPDNQKNRLFERYQHGENSRAAFARDINDPVWMARAYYAEYGRFRAVDALMTTQNLS